MKYYYHIMLIIFDYSDLFDVGRKDERGHNVYRSNFTVCGVSTSLSLQFCNYTRLKIKKILYGH